MNIVILILLCFFLSCGGSRTIAIGGNGEVSPTVWAGPLPKLSATADAGATAGMCQSELVVFAEPSVPLTAVPLHQPVKWTIHVLGCSSRYRLDNTTSFARSVEFLRTYSRAGAQRDQFLIEALDTNGQVLAYVTKTILFDVVPVSPGGGGP